MATEYSVLRSHLLDYIRSQMTDPHAQFSLDGIRHFFRNQGVELDADANDIKDSDE